MSFVHLHTHSHYSIGRAVPQVRHLVERAAELGMPALALTDYNSIAGMDELTRVADEVGIQPIIGCELDIAPFDHGTYQGRSHRIVVLVENELGYRNLVSLIGHAHAGPTGVPAHITFLDFEHFCKGLIVLTGSRRGELYYWLREQNSGQTKNYLNRLANIVGHQNLFFEVTEYPHPRTRHIMDQVLELSRYLGIGAVATQNVHFIDPEDMAAYCALVQFPRTLSPCWPLPDTDLPTRHFATFQEMQQRFGYSPELLETTLRIARRCTFRFPRHESRLPVPDLERGLDPPSALWHEAVRGAAGRYGGVTEALKERLNEEYSDICNPDAGDSGLSECFLVLRDIATQLRQEGISRGVGRGPLLHSVIAYSLGIVDADPLRYGLSYEPLRVAAGGFPLYEIETSTLGMGAALDVLRGHYGSGNIAAVGRRVDWERQRLFHQLSRWAGLPPKSLRQYHALVRDQLRGKGAHDQAQDDSDPQSDTFSEQYTTEFSTDDLGEEWNEDAEPGTDESSSQAAWVTDSRIPRGKSLRRHDTLAEVAYALHPCPRGFDADRAHFVLSKTSFEAVVPVGRTPSGQPVTQAEWPLLDRLRMLRLKFTSFGMLNVLEAATACVRTEHDSAFTLHGIPLDDEPTFRLLGLGLTNGIAPLHNITAKSLLRSNAPRNVGQLVDIHVQASKRRPGKPDQGEEDPAEIERQRRRSLPDCILSYWAAYLKAQYPVSFMVAMLTHSLESRGGMSQRQRPRFQILLREAHKMRIEVLGPDINFSGYAFSQEQNRIRTGLMVVQGMGKRTYEEVERVRHGRSFSSLGDFCQRTDPQHTPQSLIGNLIKAGVFDSLNPNRAQLLAEFGRTHKNTRRPISASHAKGDGTAQLQLFEPWMYQDGDSPTPTQETDIPETTPRDIMQYEQEAVGYSITYDQLDYYESLMEAMGAISPFDLSNQGETDTVSVAGFIDHVERDGVLVDEETEMVLDLEGFVVKIPPHLGGTDDNNAWRLQGARGPVLIEGSVRKHARAERYLIARSIHLLEAVAAMAQQVTELQLNLEGQDRHRLSAVRALLKRFRGATVVRIEGGGKRPLWSGRGIDGAGVFFCPPLYDGLRRILPDTRIKPVDQAGKVVSF